jgi:Protein of unknown function (DUF2971)
MIIMDILKKYIVNKPSGPLYHYTSLEGFLGIINSQEIWASNIFYLNDQSELYQAINLFHAELDSKIAPLRAARSELNPKAIGPETNPKIINLDAKIRFLDTAKSVAMDFVKNKRVQIYISSFTALEDDLSQWRGYSSDGNGFSIGFDFADLPTNFVLGKCSYDIAHQKQIINALLNEWFRQLEANIDANINESKPTGAGSFGIGAIISQYFTERCLNSFFTIAPFLKHPKYDKEDEWRLVISYQDNLQLGSLKFINTANVLKPYLCLKLQELPTIKKVIVGPSLHIDYNESSAKLLLIWKGMDPKVVSRSGIPYRGKI